MRPGRDLELVAGKPAAQARALVPELDVRPADRDADAALLARLALHAAVRCTPTAAPSSDDGLWLDLGGVAHAAIAGSLKRDEAASGQSSSRMPESRPAVGAAADAVRAS